MQRYGVAPAGALDALSLAAANAVVDLAPNAAAIEIGPLASQFLLCYVIS